MRNCVFASVVGAVVLFALCLPLTAGTKADSISVELKDFKFKVKESIANLFEYNEGEGKLCFYTNGAAEATVKVPADGNYEIAIRASCDSALNERAKFKLSLDGQLVGKEVLLTADEEKVYKLTAAVKAGDRKLVIEFTNDVYKENEYDRNLYVQGVTLKRVK
jgi:hypothetical protein